MDFVLLEVMPVMLREMGIMLEMIRIFFRLANVDGYESRTFCLLTKHHYWHQ